jgi:D-amino-acid dehydrogenase
VTGRNGTLRPGGSVLVVGGGLVGLQVAHCLRQAGAEVTVVERSRLGSGASRGNCGEVTSGVEPLAAPGVVGVALRGLYRPDSPLRIRPSAAVRLAPFLWRFWRAADARHFARGTAALSRLFWLSADRYDQLEAEGLARPVDVGYLSVWASARRAAEERERQERAARAGLCRAPGPLLDGPQLARQEPALTDAAKAGFCRPDEPWFDPGAVVDALAGRLAEMGVRVVEGARVTRLSERQAAVRVETERGRFEAEAAVLAAGAATAEVAAASGVPLLIEPGKGYSFSVRPAVMPRHLLDLAEGHAVATPLPGRLRIGGTMEFDGTADRFEPRRIAALAATASRFVGGVDWRDRTEEWVGPRPMTPDGLPLIGPLPGFRRTVVAAGHNMLGLTLAPATGSVVADLLMTGGAAIDLAPFHPGRALRRRVRA